MEKRNQQNEQNETLELSKDDNAVKIMKEKID